jgi:hypothetical protein
METKFFEVRDRATFMPMLAIRLQIDPGSSNDEWLLLRAGYAPDDIGNGRFVLFVMLAGGNGSAICDPYDWGSHSHTLTPAHEYIASHWDELISGQVIDAEFIRSERDEPRKSERLTEVAW